MRETKYFVPLTHYPPHAIKPGLLAKLAVPGAIPRLSDKWKSLQSCVYPSVG